MDRNIWNAYEYRRRGSKLHRSANSIIYTMAKLDHYFKFTKKISKQGIAYPQEYSARITFTLRFEFPTGRRLCFFVSESCYDCILPKSLFIIAQ